MEFIKGMDLSSYQEMSDKKKVYYDVNHCRMDAMELAKKSGVNYIRLRIWNDPASVEESGGYCGLQEIIHTAKKVKEQQMKLLLDFHYSDWWADPANQKKPKAWNELSVAGLRQAVYDYTKEVMEALLEADVYPDMVQIGNEIRTGMLFPEGAVPNWENLALFLNAGILAVRQIPHAPKIKIMIHLDQGGKYAYFKEWFDAIIAHGVLDFDVIGLSYYPFWHGTFVELKDTMERLVERYDKELILAEVAYPYRKSKGTFFREAQETAGGFEATQENQKKVMDMLFCITANISKNKGIGIFYWEPFTYGTDDENGWGNYMGFAQDDGSMTKAIESYQKNPYEIDRTQIASILLPTIFANQTKKEIEELTATILYMDATTKIEPVKVIDNQTDDSRYVKLQIAEETFLVEKEKIPDGPNYVTDAFFKNLRTAWSLQDEQKVILENANEKENEKANEEQGLYFQGKTNFSCSVKQTIKGLTPGTYQPYLIYEGENTTGVDITFFVNGRTFACETKVFPRAQGAAYFKTNPIVIKEVPEDIIIGVTVQAPPIWGRIKEMILVSLQES